MFLLAILFALPLIQTGADVRAQQPATMQAPPQQPQRQGAIIADVNLVVLHVTVVDQRGRFVPDLKQENFRIFEDRVEQKVDTFRREDVPVTVGLVIDNSGSMRDKRERVNAAALTFIKASNRDDQVFVVNFNDDYYLDLDKDFTNDVNELKEALERIDSRGSTAFYDAIIGSLDHLKKGSRDKKVLLAVTDGEDNASRHNLEATMVEAQQSDAIIYGIGLLGKEKAAKRARRAMESLANATGGLSFFPEGLADVESICEQVAHDIRNQYTIAYYPTNKARDGSFRGVAVQLVPPRGRGKLSVRHRTGYYAQKTPSAGGN